MDHSRQLVFRPNPDLYKHSVVDVGHHVCRWVADMRLTDIAGDMRLTDVIGELQTSGHVLVGIGNDQIIKRKVSSRKVIVRLHGGVDRRRRVGNSNQVLRRCVGRHGLAVVVELGGRTIARRDDPQLVGPLQGDFELIRKDQRMALAARAFIGLDRGERHGVSRGQPVAGGLKDRKRLGFEGGWGGGRGRFGRLRGLLLRCLCGLRKRCPCQEEQPENEQQDAS